MKCMTPEEVDDRRFIKRLQIAQLTGRFLFFGFCAFLLWRLSEVVVAGCYP